MTMLIMMAMMKLTILQRSALLLTQTVPLTLPDFTSFMYYPPFPSLQRVETTSMRAPV